MTDRDAFELRVGAAVRGYVGRVSSDLDPVELAHRIALAQPRRRGVAGVLEWRGTAIPRVAWTLLLAAVLLAALAAGMLIVGGIPRQPTLPAMVPPAVPSVAPSAEAPAATPVACPPGANPNAAGPVDQERPARNASAAIAFDRRAGRIVLLAPSAGAGAETWTFDVCLNVYVRMRPDREPALLGQSRLVYDSDADVTIATDGRSTWAYDLEANGWTQGSTPPAVASSAAPSLAYDPVSGLVLAAAGHELWSYDVGTDTWALVSEAPWLGPAVLAYDASVDRIVADSGSKTWLFRIRSGTWSRGTDPTFCAWGMAMVLPDVIVYDEAVQRTVVSCGTRAAYDAAAGRWELMTDLPGSFPSSMAFDTVNQRLVGIGEIQAGVVAFDLQTHKQVILLEPVRGQAAP